MKKQKKQLDSFPLRLQGTDGIRREVRPQASKEFKGLTPLEVFLEQGFITEDFMELYAFAYAGYLLKTGKMRPSETIVVGWDPRDVNGDFTGAVVKGIRKAGATALTLGIVPTPLVPTYMLYKTAKAGFMITASHNPKDQNGIKTFCAYRGMKLLPENDIELTLAIRKVDHASLKNTPLKGTEKDCRNEALELFNQFTLHPENSWSDPDVTGLNPYKKIILVVDPARGSLSKMAADAFRSAGFGRVIEINAEQDGNVNLFSGVGDLEGQSVITPQMIDKRTGHFRKHKAVLKLFGLGRKFKTKILAGEKRVAGAVFDGDGDRFYRLEYDPFKDALLVLSGDETAFLQAMYLIKRDPKRYKNALYINTVESDLNTAVAAKQLGLKPKLAAVGDKWILLKTAFMMVELRLKFLKKISQRELPATLKKQWDDIRKNGALDVDAFQKIESRIDTLEKKYPSQKSFDTTCLLPFAVGSEETGHNITPGWLDMDNGNRMPVFFGNGLKSALNTFAATEHLFNKKSVRAYFSAIHKPFKPGFKGTLYVYYIKKELFHKDSAIWKKIKRSLLADVKTIGFKGRVVNFPEDPDMLYIALTPTGGKSPTAGIFVRNSGTENKISVNLRGNTKDARSLKKIGENAIRLLLGTLKDVEDHYYKLELDVLSQVATGTVPEGRLILEKHSRNRILAEMGKQDLIELTAKGYRLTQRGKWYIASNAENSKQRP
jgi:phosphomannomutase